nr:MAG TPA: hypothetical protein [Caudoviricetes sp.]
MTIGNPPPNPLHPKGSGGDFLSPLLSHDMRGLMKTKSNHVYILFEQP